MDMSALRMALISCVAFVWGCSPLAEGQSGRSFPVWQVMDSFDQLEPLLRNSDDTTRIINFWATWCKPCVAELPVFEEVYERTVNQPVQMVLVSLDFPNQIDTKLRPFIRENDLRPPVIALTDIRFNDWIDRVDPSWSGSIPATLIYRGSQRVFLEQRIEDVEELELHLKAFLD
jgi:thiol-disulfide isomerase/thioredoxin